jgi:hypothetical protein
MKKIFLKLIGFFLFGSILGGIGGSLPRISFSFYPQDSAWQNILLAGAIIGVASLAVGIAIHYKEIRDFFLRALIEPRGPIG